MVELDKSFVTFKEVLPENLSCAESDYGKIYIDTTRTPKLLSEALAREVVRRAQVMRKEMNLPVDEFVDILIQAKTHESANLLADEREYLMTEIRVKKLNIIRPNETFAPPKDAYTKEWDIDGVVVKIAITRLKNNNKND
jgi:isoleucyl-tRNA synthetase